jgi:beta-lactamase class A
MVVGENAAGQFSAAHRPELRLFVGSAVKTFILAQYLREVEAGRLSEDQKITIDDSVRSLSSPVFLNLSGSTSARSVLEAMIAHSDNTATDAALATVSPGRVRALVAEAGLASTQLPDSTRRLFSYVAGAERGQDLGWDGVQRMANGAPAGQSRSALNDEETMASTAEDMVGWYRRALKGDFFNRPSTLLEFKRIQAMADAIVHVAPADTMAYAKGGSIDWAGFHCLSFAGQMIVRQAPVTFCFTINWTGADDGVPKMFEAYAAAIREVLSQAAQAVH